MYHGRLVCQSPDLGRPFATGTAAVSTKAYLYGAILARKSTRWMSAGGGGKLCSIFFSGTHQQNGSRQDQHKISSELDQGRCPTWEAPLPRGPIRPCRILNSQQDAAA